MKKSKDIKGYKLLRVRKNGTISPLFINKKQLLPIGKWLKAEAHKTPGYAFRPGWHAVSKPLAPHLSKKDRAWYKVILRGVEKYKRPKNQGESWLIARWMKIEKKVG